MLTVANHEIELLEVEDFFPPAPHGLVDGLLAEYGATRKHIETACEMVNGKGGWLGVAVSYLLEANRSRQHHHGLEVDDLFRADAGIAALDARYWQRVMDMTDLYALMPNARREEWNAAIREHKAPEFTAETVQATLESLFSMRERFFAERVDGIFRGLSGSHVTNSPQGFNAKLILNYVFNEYGHGTSKTGLINDLRCIIARFMGRDEPKHYVSRGDLEMMRRSATGVWHTMDAGALRVRVYKCGTAHLHVSEEIAWRLNAVLHSLYPQAIAEDARKKPAKRAKTFKMMGRPLPFAVLAVLREIRPNRSMPLTMSFGYGAREDSVAFKEACAVLESLGAVVDTKGGSIRFDYDAGEVLREVLFSGCIPDRQSHQFYPTPAALAERAVALAGIEFHHVCCEPSAGQGGIAQFMPKGRTVCVEISELYAQVLASKGHLVERADFLEWAAGAKPVDRIVMNPPYSEKRWLTHLQAAGQLLRPGGRVVAILPASMHGKDLLPGLSFEWSEVLANQFQGTSVAVAIYVGTRE